eukprot:TRINITY_DN4839_c0_g1_i4.p1 TRINITY_DN4839_c0_g1~~TRINITY_DN4839_c0_g1_i4.p1  ORF type:complete len:138 (+),score=7.63 TRINITY_DN4839_c0_g1_i4:208-621(+)
MHHCEPSSSLSLLQSSNTMHGCAGGYAITTITFPNAHVRFPEPGRISFDGEATYGVLNAYFPNYHHPVRCTTLTQDGPPRGSTGCIINDDNNGKKEHVYTVDDDDDDDVLASLSRTTEVMKVANFLGLLPLVELCGL